MYPFLPVDSRAASDPKFLTKWNTPEQMRKCSEIPHKAPESQRPFVLHTIRLCPVYTELSHGRITRDSCKVKGIGVQHWSVEWRLLYMTTLLCGVSVHNSGNYNCSINALVPDDRTLCSVQSLKFRGKWTSSLIEANPPGLESVVTSVSRWINGKRD
jgi:hypothetical protein